MKRTFKYLFHSKRYVHPEVWICKKTTKLNTVERVQIRWYAIYCEACQTWHSLHKVERD